MKAERGEQRGVGGGGCEKRGCENMWGFRFAFWGRGGGGFGDIWGGGGSDGSA